MPYLPYRAVPRNRHAPFLGAIDDISAFEARVAHLPQRRCEPASDQTRVYIRPTFAPYELVPEPRSVFRRKLCGGRLLPFGPECDPAILERGIGGRFRVGAVDLQRRRVAVEVGTERYRQQSRNSKKRQRTLHQSGPAPGLSTGACRDGVGNSRSALPRTVTQDRGQLQPPSCAYPVQSDDG